MNSPYFQNIRKEIIKALNKADHSVKIAMAWFTNAEIFHTILDCCRRGVEVGLVLMDDEINHMDFGNDFTLFTEAGGSLYLFSKAKKMMHNKFCVIDDILVITGSYNWTNYAEKRNCENIIATDDPEVVKMYSDEFLRLKECAEECSEFETIQLQDMADVAFRARHSELSEEIESLPESQHKIYGTILHEKRTQYGIIETCEEKQLAIPKEVQVFAVENRKHPVSKYNIGFKAYLKEKGDVGLKVLIAKGTELPFTFTRDAWSNIDGPSEMKCEFYYGESTELSQCKSFANLTLRDLPYKKQGELKFKTSITFTTDGHIHLEFVCANTGKGEVAKCESKEYVEYKD